MAGIKLDEDWARLLRDAFHDRPLVDLGPYRFVVNPLTEQAPATTAALLEAAARSVLAVADLERVNLLVSEEDRGGALVGAVSLLSGLPFGMARWHPAGAPGEVRMSFAAEHLPAGWLYLNGVRPGDRVLIVEDLLSTGGTMIALIQAVRQAGAEIADAVAVAVKSEYGGADRVRRETGVAVKTLVRIDVGSERSRVVEPVGWE